MIAPALLVTYMTVGVLFAAWVLRGWHARDLVDDEELPRAALACLVFGLFWFPLTVTFVLVEAARRSKHR
jgi:hypothetical protein